MTDYYTADFILAQCCRNENTHILSLSAQNTILLHSAQNTILLLSAQNKILPLSAQSTI